MGKRKYQAVRQASSMKSSNLKRGNKTAINFMPNCPIPKLITYNSLVSEIKKIDIGKVYYIEEEFSTDIDDENINGCFRDLREYLPRLAKFYLLRIQVERLMTSVIAFVITVDWLRCEANCQTLLGGGDSVLYEKRRVTE